MKEPSQEHPQKAKAGGNQSALSVNKENAIDGRQKENVPEVMLAAFSTIHISVEQVLGHLLRLQIRRRAMMEKTLQEVNRAKGARDRAEIFLLVIVRSHRVTHEIHPNVAIISHSQAAHLATSVRSFTEKRTVNQRDRKRAEEKTVLPLYGLRRIGDVYFKKRSR